MSIFEKSEFIWIDDKNADTYGEFYATFTANSSPICHLSVDGDYTLFINGKFVASNQYGDFEHYKIYDEINLSDFIFEGENHFALLVHHIGKDNQRYKRYDAGVIFEIIENDKLLLTSNESILSRKSKSYISGACREITGQLGFSYTYDAENCEKLEDKLAKIKIQPSERASIGAIIGAHVGPGAYGVVYVSK